MISVLTKVYSLIGKKSVRPFVYPRENIRRPRQVKRFLKKLSKKLLTSVTLSVI